MSTKIEWTDETWNPVTGCAKVSQGCKNCYAERLWPKVEGARVKREGGEPRPFTHVSTHPDRLDQPLRWAKPRRIFVNSMSDLFHEDIPDEFIAQIFLRMAYSPRHTFQVLTKRPHRMLDWMFRCGLDSVRWGESEEIEEQMKSTPWPLRNVWLGVSVEDQPTADERIPLLLQTPAAVRFLSCEPLLGQIDLTRALYGASDGRGQIIGHSGRNAIDWVIAGGESGPHARPSNPEWFRTLRDQCAAAGVAFFFKQWGNWLGAMQDGDPEHKPFIVNSSDQSLHTTKRAAGRLLDGRTHDEYPA